MRSDVTVVLVVEDDALTRQLAVELLSENGHEVMQASDAGRALTILNDQAGRIDLLFTDIQMPGHMNGSALARYVHVKWPWIAQLVTSGMVRPKPAALPAATHFLAKPYRSRDVLSQIQELIGLTRAPDPGAELVMAMQKRRQHLAMRH